MTEKPHWLTSESEAILNRGYLLQGEDLEAALERICFSMAKKAELKSEETLELSNKYKNSIRKGWMSLSSPIWSNAGTARGLPISCFNVHIPDSIEGIADKLSEVIMQTKIGGGTSGNFSELRHRGASIRDNGKSSGAVSFMELFDSTMNVVSQGSVRRGAFAAYLDIDHPDIKEFLKIKDIGHKIQNIFPGVCVPDYWMQEMIDGDQEKRDLWASVLKSRQEKGLPYIFFTNNVNKNKPIIYKELKLNIGASNLCTEIMLPSTEEESFICCLASMNIELYDEWKDTDAVELAIQFLDAVQQEFIDKTIGNTKMKPARDFAIRHRAVGLGVLGWHSYLQKNMIPFESFEASLRNTAIFNNIRTKADAASVELGIRLGVAPIFNEVKDTKDTPRRNTTVMAVAPTTSSSAILGQASPGIEPFLSNYFKAGLSKGNFMRKNKHLQILLESKGMDTEEVWSEIMINGGSVSNLSGLTEEEKDVFKTFREISQLVVIQQAAARQKFIDQGQSLNLNIPSDLPIKEVNKLFIEAWKLDIKSIYYQRSKAVSKDMLTNIVSCKSCEA